MRRREWVAAIGGAAGLATAVFAIGGVFRWGQSAVAFCFAVSVATYVLSRRSSVGLSPLVVMLLVALGLTAIQLVPLPSGLIELLQPNGSSLRADGAQLAGVSPWQALTFDASSTLRALTYFIILLGVAVVGVRISASEHGRFRINAAVAVVCGLTALTVGAHVFLGADSLYGLYTPQAQPSVLGPLLNENHLGCLMAVGTTVSLGVAFYPRQSTRVRALWCFVALISAVTTFASQSRGAAIAVIGGVAVTVGILIGQRIFGSEDPRKRSSGSFTTTTLPIALVVISAAIVILYASAGGVSDQISHTHLHEIESPTSKFGVWRSTLDLIHSTPWVGVGRGAFEPAFTQYHPASAILSFKYVENEYLQAVADWGIPGAALLALATIWMFVVAFRRWRLGPLAAGALGALVAVAMQSVLDFGVELLGVAVPITLIAASITFAPFREGEGKPVRTRAALAVLTAGLAVAGLLLLLPTTRTIAEDQEALDARGSHLTFRDIQGELERHPLDYYGYSVAARQMVAKGDPQSVRFLNQALRLHPTHPGLHHMAARLLFRLGHPDQAAIEYAHALKYMKLSPALLVEISSRLDAKHAATAIPITAEVGVVSHMLEELNRTDIDVEWLARVADLQPSSEASCEMLYQLSLRPSGNAAAKAASDHCDLSRWSYTERLGLARVLFTAHQELAATHLLEGVERWPGRLDQKFAGWALSCELLFAQNNWAESRRCLRRLEVSGLVTRDVRGLFDVQMGQVDQAIRSAAIPAPE